MVKCGPRSEVHGVPESSRVVLFLKDTGLVPDDNTVAVRLFSHVGCVARPVDGDKKATITQPYIKSQPPIQHYFNKKSQPAVFKYTHRSNDKLIQSEIL